MDRAAAGNQHGTGHELALVAREGEQRPGIAPRPAMVGREAGHGLLLSFSDRRRPRSSAGRRPTAPADRPARRSDVRLRRPADLPGPPAPQPVRKRKPAALGQADRHKRACDAAGGSGVISEPATACPGHTPAQKIDSGHGLFFLFSMSVRRECVGILAGGSPTWEGSLGEKGDKSNYSFFLGLPRG